MPATIEKKAACFTDSSAHLRQTGFLPLLALSYGYTAGGPFGYEEIFRASGPGMSLLFLMFVPFVWSIPVCFAAAEMNSILPVQGGFYRWVRVAFGDFWGFQCGWWNWTGTFLLNSVYGVLLMDYLHNYIPGLTGEWKWAGATFALCLLSYLNIRGIQIAGGLHRPAIRDFASRRVALHRFAIPLAAQPSLAFCSTRDSFRECIRKRPRSSHVELRWLRAAFERDR